MSFINKIVDPVLHVHIVTNRNVAIAEENLNAPVSLGVLQVVGLLGIKKKSLVPVIS